MGRCLRMHVIVGVLATTVLVGPALAEGPTLKALDDVFALNNLQGFAQAEASFAEAYRRGDLDTMMAVLRSTFHPAAECWYPGVCESMTDAALPIAEDRAQWATIGELRVLRYQVMISLCWAPGIPALATRCGREVEIASVAYQKAGTLPHDLTSSVEYARHYAPYYAKQREEKRAERLQSLGPDYAAAFDAIDEAVILHDDARAVALCQELLGIIEADPDGPRKLAAARGLAAYLWLRGSEPMVPRLIQLADQHAGWQQALALVEKMMDFLLLPWSGRDDIYYEAWYWCARVLEKLPNEGFDRGTLFMQKMQNMGRTAEADRLARVWVQWVWQYRSGKSQNARYLIHPQVPDDIRRMATVLILRYAGNNPEEYIKIASGFVEVGDEEHKPARAYETATLLTEFAAQFPEAGGRAAAVSEAARLFEKAGRPDLAEQAAAAAMMFASSDPAALAATALARGSWAAEQGDWQGAITIMEPVFAGQPPSRNMMDAAILLASAYVKLGDTGRAAGWFQAALAGLDQVTLKPYEAVSALYHLAELATDRERKFGLLMRARDVALASGLEMLQENAAQHMARVSLQCGDLAGARTALLDITQQAEGRRERLAFDPRLRQQWFADNIGPYRQLIRVAELQGDVELALGCAERMRGRALLDELAWKKIDLQVPVPPQLSQRMAQLRATRQQAYELLARVMGGTAATDSRGAYMPIRGLYMPVRGGLEQEAPVTDADVARLRAMLDALAAEEAALEGAIREQVPAYARAASLSIPSGAEIAAEVARHPGLAVLEYTFADQGLAVVTLASGETQVELIDCDRDALYEQIGRFREAIWERSNDARKQARDLYRTLVAPVEDALSGAQRLWIVADGAVQLVPFAALLDGSGQYLGQRLPIAFAPSLTLALSSRAERSAPARAAVIVAAPDTGAPEMKSGSEDDRGYYMPIRGMYLPVRGAYMPIRGEGEVSSALTAMAHVPLPEAKAEGEAIAGRFADALLLTGADATKSALVQAGGDCGMLHIATHGYADPDFPDFSGLLLAAPQGSPTPYQVLTAGEVYGWPLNARLVTLSACQTALGRDVEGEGILGLSRAFIYAGAQDVVCSLWPVSDESTRMLMTAFYDALAAGAPVEEALQAGQNALPHTGEKGDPFYWAGFVAVRGPA
jgi:CHAT domain-containing protein